VTVQCNWKLAKQIGTGTITSGLVNLNANVSKRWHLGVHRDEDGQNATAGATDVQSLQQGNGP